jgi:penicillin amidase
LISSILKWSFIQYNKRSLKNKYYDSKLVLDGISKPVNVYADEWQIPTIYAENSRDMFFMQGFIHARDRLWQMEMNRRIGMGTLAEAFGVQALPTDRLTRTLGFKRIAEKELKNLSDENLSIINAYISGVNEFINQGNYAIEFRIAGIKPQQWEPIHIMAWSKVLAWTLSHGWSGSLIRKQIVDTVGKEMAKELQIIYQDENPVVLPKGLEFNNIEVNEIFNSAKGPYLQKDLEGGGRGSNAWVISGKFTKSGLPILSNDTHLMLSQPGIWYLNQLHSEDGYHISGASIAGVPGILIGHNNHIAWGITLAYTDCEDIFYERLNPADKSEYIVKDKKLKLQQYEEKIFVKKEDPFIETVRCTIHGPLIGEFTEKTEERISLCSMPLQENRMIEGFMLLNMATDYNDFSKAIEKIDAPQLNFIYGDVAGNIGFRISGAVPIRKSGTGELPKPGWTGEFDWIDTIPYADMPACLNPEQNFVISTNNKPVDDNYPYYLGNSFMNGYRAKRIKNFIKSHPVITIENCEELMMDVYSIPGMMIVEGLIKKFRSARPKSQKLINILLGWDGKLAIDSSGGAAYEVLYFYLIKNMLEPKLGKELTVKVLGSGPHPLLLPVNELLGHATTAFFRIIQNSESKWVPSTESAVELIDKSLENACTWLENNLGFESSGWTWGQIHQASFKHSMSIKKVLDKIFSSESFPIPGDTDTVHQTAYNPNSPYDATSWCPSMRMIIDLSDFNKSRMIAPPGNSGVLGSAHYQDQIPLWKSGVNINMYWKKEDVIKNSKYILEVNSES